ncbi:MAG TPA: sugar ABC transporter substrate-binding protein [Thermotogota bacterium]|nr:sugar ABC transporter substrate-binding protein [Thermotogota bacterium]
MKKLMILTLVLLIAFTAFAKTTKIEVWTLSLSPWFDDYMNDVNKSFEEANPGVEVEWVDVAYDAGLQKLQAAIAAGTAPDVVNMNTIWAIDLVALEALTPMDEYLTEVDKYRYWPQLLAGNTIDEQLYSIPWYASPQILIYNREIFEEAGLDPDNPPETWEEMLEVSRIIKEKTGKYGFEPTISGFEDLMLEGIQLVSEDGKKATFNTPDAIAKLNWYKTLFEEDLIPRTLGGYTAGRENYSAGKIAMYPVGMSMLKHIQENSPSIYAVTDVAPLPLGKAEMLKSAMMNFVIPVNAEHKQEAADYIMWITSSYWQVEFDKHASIVPSTKIGLDTDPYFVDKAETDLQAKAQIMASLSMEYVRDIGFIPGLEQEKFAEFRRVLDEIFMDAIKGDYTAEEALELAEEEINKVLR